MRKGAKSKEEKCMEWHDNSLEFLLYRRRGSHLVPESLEERAGSNRPELELLLVEN